MHASVPLQLGVGQVVGTALAKAVGMVGDTEGLSVGG